MALYLASRHPQTPWYARVLAIVIVGYAFSPIDLIPDPIPILGYLDDAILLPIGIWMVRKMIPEAILTECREQAASTTVSRPKGRLAAVVIVVLWILAFLIVARLISGWIS